MEKIIRRIAQLIKRRKFNQAGVLAAELTKRYSNEPRAWRKRAFVRTLQGRNANAVSDMTKAIALNNFRSLDYFFERGVAWFQMRKYANALEDFTQTIALGELFKMDSHRIQAHFFRAECHVRLKNFAQAKADCDHVPDTFKTWTDGAVRSKKDLLTDCSVGLRNRKGEKIRTK